MAANSGRWNRRGDQRPLAPRCGLERFGWRRQGFLERLHLRPGRFSLGASPVAAVLARVVLLARSRARACRSAPRACAARARGCAIGFVLAGGRPVGRLPTALTGIVATSTTVLARQPCSASAAEPITIIRTIARIAALLAPGWQCGWIAAELTSLKADFGFPIDGAACNFAAADARRRCNAPSRRPRHRRCRRSTLAHRRSR